jgi:hypothetical protein
MTADEVRRMDAGEVLIYTRGQPAIRAQQLQYYTQPFFKERAGIAPPKVSDRIITVPPAQSEREKGQAVVTAAQASAGEETTAATPSTPQFLGHALRDGAARMKHHVAVYLEERLVETGESPASQRGAAVALIDEKNLDKIVRAAVLRELRPFVNQLNLLTAMLDQIALSVLMNLPEIAEAQKPQAIAAGRWRHQGWRESVAELMQENLPQAAADGAET